MGGCFERAAGGSRELHLLQKSPSDSLALPASVDGDPRQAATAVVVLPLDVPTERATLIDGNEDRSGLNPEGKLLGARRLTVGEGLSVERLQCLHVVGNRRSEQYATHFCPHGRTLARGLGRARVGWIRVSGARRNRFGLVVRLLSATGAGVRWWPVLAWLQLEPNVTRPGAPARPRPDPPAHPPGEDGERRA